MVRGMELAGRFPAETRHIRGTLAYTQLDYVATLWTRRRFEPGAALRVPDTGPIDDTAV